jgi:peptidoglycan hydrolase-like protein with peptidoglycan-binding domain
MKRLLPYLGVALCGVTLARADETIRSLQQTLKNHGLYYGAVTGDKSAETNSAIRRYQIRYGLQVTGELNEETLRSVNANGKSVATAAAPTSKSAGVQADNIRPAASAPLKQSSRPTSVTGSDRPPQINPSYAASFYQATPVRTNRRMIAEAQYQLLSRGYYGGRVDGNYGRQTAFAVRAFQSSAGLSPTGHLDMPTLEALGSGNTARASSAPAPPAHDMWRPVRKFKNGKWKMKWERYYRPSDGLSDEAEQVNRQPAWNPYNRD